MAQIAMILATLASIYGAVEVWFPWKKKERKTAEKAIFSVVYGVLAILFGLIAINPDAALSLFGY